MATSGDISDFSSDGSGTKVVSHDLN